MSDDVEEEEDDDDDAPTDGAVAPRLAGTTDGGADEFCVKDKVRGTMVCNGDAAVGESPLGSSTTIDEDGDCVDAFPSAVNGDVGTSSGVVAPAPPPRLSALEDLGSAVSDTRRGASDLWNSHTSSISSLN